MPDFIDQTQEREDAILNARIRNIRAKASEELKPKGSCYFCAEPLNEGMKFCDKDCAEDYQKEQRQKRSRLV